MDEFPHLWFYRTDDGKRGPVDTESLQEMLRTGVLRRQSSVWRHGMAAWTPAEDVADLLPATIVGSALAMPASPSRKKHLAIMTLPLLALAASVAGLALFSPSAGTPARTPDSLQERLIFIGRSAQLESMPLVIDSLANPDPAVAATALTVAERILGVRYSAKDRANPQTLAGKIRDDWMTVQSQLRRRRTGQGDL